MQMLTKIVYNVFYKPFLKIYLRTDSNVTFDGFKLKVFKEVFHPKLFFSTSYFYEFIKKQKLDSLQFLEIGCGSGILSLIAYKKGSIVTAVDINEKAVENTKINFLKNFNNIDSVTITKSDLFTNIPKRSFDIIVINPPYYFKKIQQKTHLAWYCGENGEYFEKLFSTISEYTLSNTLIYMILEENCEIERIKDIGKKNKFVFDLIEERKIKWEKSYIFGIKPISS